MSRRLTWWLAILLSCGFWFGAIYLGGKAAAAPVTDAPAFLAKRGLIANPVPIVSVPLGALDNKTQAGSNADGAAFYDHVAIEDWLLEMGGLPLAAITLHEYLHEASYWRWAPDELDVIVDARGVKLYEEGLVEAVTYDMLPAWWRYLTGRRLRADVQPGSTYFSEVVTWRVWSARATGKPWRSPEAKAWRAAALNWSPTVRMDAANRITEETQ